MDDEGHRLSSEGGALMGGKPSKGTKADKRLGANKPKPKTSGGK